MNNTETPLLTVALGREAHAIASEFAAQQATPVKGKRVYLNSLAVYAVHSYLRWLEIESNLDQSDSWHLGCVALFDVADLMISGVGKLECRPILPGETTLALPREAIFGRIGYVAVQFHESLEEVQLLGFAPPVKVGHPPELIALANLQPLDALLDYIAHAVHQTTNSQILVNLSHWFENSFQAGWQTLEALFCFPVANPAFTVRSSDASNFAGAVSGGKLIDLGIQLATYPVALVVTLTPTVDDAEIDIRLRVYPTGRQIYLPSSLQLMVLDESGDTCLEAEARSVDNWIQLEFIGKPGERFSVKLALADVSISENFVI
jgi:hypothetical protein